MSTNPNQDLSPEVMDSLQRGHRDGLALYFALERGGTSESRIAADLSQQEEVEANNQMSLGDEAINVI